MSMKTMTKKLILALCMALLCVFTIASAEEITTFEIPTESTVFPIGVAEENVSARLVNNEGIWSLSAVTAGEEPGELVEAEIPADLVSVAALVDGVEIPVELKKVALVSTTEDGLKLTFNANDVAAYFGDKYAVGDLKATTLTFDVEDVTSVKVTFQLFAPVTIYYTDGVDGVELFPTLKFTAKIGDPMPQYDGVAPTRDDHAFSGWGPMDPFVRGPVIYQAQWREYFDVIYYDWYDEKILEQFEVLDGDPTPIIDPHRYTKDQFVNMGFTTDIAPIVTGDATYTMIQMKPPCEDNVTGLNVICSCCVYEDGRHNMTFRFSDHVADLLILEDVSNKLYIDNSNPDAPKYKCYVYLSYTDFIAYYNDQLTDSHFFCGSDCYSFSVTLSLDAKKWVADRSYVSAIFECTPSASMLR